MSEMYSEVGGKSLFLVLSAEPRFEKLDKSFASRSQTRNIFWRWRIQVCTVRCAVNKKYITVGHGRRERLDDAECMPRINVSVGKKSV